MPWLCEELGINYELNTYEHSPFLAPPEYKALLHSAERHQSFNLAESGVCIEYISREYANRELFLDRTHPSCG